MTSQGSSSRDNVRDGLWRTVALTAAVCAAVAGSAVIGAVDVDAQPAGEVYVALGDSFASGAGISPIADAPCQRSAVNYASLVASRLDAGTFRDATCGAAVSADFESSQTSTGSSSIAPQYDALSADTTLVTVGIGGNDIGLVEMAIGCISVLPAPFSPSCAARYTKDGKDTYGDAVAAFAPRFGDILEQIHQRAPKAAILTVGYPTGIRPGGCPGAQPILAEDATYLQAKISQLNGVIEAESAVHGATFVDLEPSTQGHDGCAVEDSFIVGLIPSGPDGGTPLHPNAAGHRNAAEQVLATIER